MSTITKTKVTTIILNSKNAMDWINDNIALSRHQWTKDDESGNLAILIDSQFVDELLDEMQDELNESDFTVVN